MGFTNTTRPSKPGHLVSLLLDVSTREVEVRDIEHVGPRFRVITLGGEQLRGQRWAPGDMVQLIASGAAFFGPWELRSYTPFAFDPDAGAMPILAVIHGGGPGSDWFASAQTGTRCRVVGPRFALSMPKRGEQLLFFGDETSFSTAIAFHSAWAGDHEARFVFEVDSVDESRGVLERFGMGSAKLVSRTAGDRHHDELEQHMLDACRVAHAPRIVLTGKASSIQRLNRALRSAGVPSRGLTNVAYWAPGRKGLKGR